MPGRNVICRVKFGQFWTFDRPAAILDFAINEKLFRSLVPRVKWYVYATFCPNWMSRIRMPGRNVICRVKFGQFWTFDRRRPSWILIKMKNSSARLFLMSSSMSMPNLVQIGWTGSELFKKMWFFPPHPHPQPPSPLWQSSSKSSPVGAKKSVGFFIQDGRRRPFWILQKCLKIPEQSNHPQWFGTSGN